MKTKKVDISRIVFLTVVLFTLSLGVPVARADLAEVKQVVYGMDCAPCAYSVQKNLEALPGVESAKVSLNDGMVDVKLKPGSGVTVARVQQVIKDAGFTPKEAKTIER